MAFIGGKLGAIAAICLIAKAVSRNVAAPGKSPGIMKRPDNWFSKRTQFANFVQRGEAATNPVQVYNIGINLVDISAQAMGEPAG